MQTLMDYMRRAFNRIIDADSQDQQDAQINAIFDTIIKLHAACDPSETSLSLLLQRFELCSDLVQRGFVVPDEVLGPLFIQGIFSDPTCPIPHKGEYADITQKELMQYILLKAGADGSFIDRFIRLIDEQDTQTGYCDEHAALLNDINLSHACADRNDYYLFAVGNARRHIGRDIDPARYATFRTDRLQRTLQQNFIFITGVVPDANETNARENMRWEVGAMPQIINTAAQITRSADIYRMQAKPF